MNFPLELVPHPSRLMMAGLVAGHSVLGLAFLCSSLPAWIIGSAWLGLVSSTLLAYRGWRRLARCRFVLGQEGAIQVVPPAGAAFEARVGQGCRDLGWAVWLAWYRTEDTDGKHGRRGVLMLPRDALPPEAWRALRIWLKFRSGLAAPEAP